MHSIDSKWRKPRRSAMRKAKYKAVLKNITGADNNIKETVNITSIQSSTVTASTSATERKLSFFNKERAVNIDNSEYLIVHTTALNELIQSYYCSSCNKVTRVKVNYSQRNGLAVLIRIICSNCDTVATEAFSSPPVSEKKNKFDINRKFVEAFLKNGFSGLLSFCATVNVHPMSESAYYGQLRTMKFEATTLKKNVLEQSRAAVKKFHATLNPEVEDSANCDILVSFDGSWHKRGHTSSYGIGCAIDVLTGLVIDYEVLSKYCHLCTLTMHDLGADSPEFHLWHEGHKKSLDCAINFEGSSGAMEMTIAEILWKRSQSDCHMRYTTLLSDGDSKTLTHLKKLNLYDIQKEECINHVSKRLYSSLCEVIKNCKARNVTLGGKKVGALTNKVILTLSGYYRSAIVRNKNDVAAMKKDILATLTHCSSTDNNPNHSDCPSGQKSWCFYNKAIAMNEIPPSHSSMKVVLNKLVVSEIQPVYERLISDELLQRCTKCLTQNSNEALHSVIWRKCPKNIFVSRAKIELAAVNAVSEFNMGYVETGRSTATIRGALVSEVSESILRTRDRKRQSDSLRKTDPSCKRERIVAKLSKGQKENKKVKLEGPTYGPGKF